MVGGGHELLRLEKARVAGDAGAVVLAIHGALLQRREEFRERHRDCLRPGASKKPLMPAEPGTRSFRPFMSATRF